MTPRLPLEILTAIVKELDNVQDLCRVRMACHALCAVATPITFRTLSVITTRASAQNLGRLFDLPDIAAHVREVSYHDAGADRRGRALNYGASSPRYPINHITNCACAPGMAGDVSSNQRQTRTGEFIFSHSPITAPRDHQLHVLPTLWSAR